VPAKGTRNPPACSTSAPVDAETADQIRAQHQSRPPAWFENNDMTIALPLHQLDPMVAQGRFGKDTGDRRIGGRIIGDAKRLPWVERPTEDGRAQV
jgi:hypothetical protein